MKHSLWHWQREAERSLARSRERRRTEPDGARWFEWALLALLIIAVVLVLIFVHI